MSIAKRAAQAIRERAAEHNVYYKEECHRIGVSRDILCNLERKETNPSAYTLQQMALNGYDIIWILTGKKGNTA